MFEVIGRVLGLAAAAAEVGFEWLNEWSPDEDLDEDDDATENRTDEGEVGASKPDIPPLYLTMPTTSSLERLLELWNAYTRKEPAGKDRAPWWALFKYLKDIRVWSARDRVEALVSEYLRSTPPDAETGMLRLELNLWFRGASEDRDIAASQMVRIVSDSGGRVLDVYAVEPIEYFGMLVDLPPAEALQLAGLGGPLATAAQLMTVRPQSISSNPANDEEPEILPGAPPRLEALNPRPPIAALLDGQVADAHGLLANRVSVTEVDVSGTLAGDRFHGTAMASLILHGDLGRNGESCSRVLKVVPVLRLAAGGRSETTPRDKLVVGIVHRAVLSLVAGLNGGPPASPSVVLINHSICDDQSSFSRRPSAWARLLDYLSFRYRLLFVVSAGNHESRIEIKGYKDRNDLTDDDVAVRQGRLLLALQGAADRRRLRSPAEALNAVTVGALHADYAGPCPANSIDPFVSEGLTALYSATGMGINGSVKPDLVEAGGRQLLSVATEGGRLMGWGRSIGQIGQLAAAPAGTLTLNKTARLCGTSNAAALTTGNAIRIADAVEAVFAADSVNWLDLPTRAVMLKALLAHGCRWSAIGTGQVESAEDRKKTNAACKMVTRFTGNGQPKPELVISGSSKRITLLAEGSLGHNQLHEYRLPIPASLIRHREIRRIVLTLAWSSPIAPSTASYREIGMQVIDENGKTQFWRGVSNVRQPTSAAQAKGTLIHRVLEGASAVRGAVIGGMFIGVQAWAARQAAYNGPPAPYALAVSLEVGPSITTDIHAEISATIRANLKARTPVRIGRR